MPRHSYAHVVGHFLHEFQLHGVSGCVVVIRRSRTTPSTHQAPEEALREAVDLFFLRRERGRRAALLAILREAFRARACGCDAGATRATRPLVPGRLTNSAGRICSEVRAVANETELQRA